MARLRLQSQLLLSTLLINGIGAIDFAIFTQMTPPPGSDGSISTKF